MKKKIFYKVFGLTILSAALIFGGCGESAENNFAEKNLSAQTVQEKFPQFTTTNLNGEKVTSEIFANKKITMINIWGTFCPPCIEEMPEIGEWEKNLPADVQVVGLVCDVEGSDDAQTINAAKKILRKANANFLNIVPSDEIMSYLDKVDAVPTTIFVDAQGNIIGEPIIGAQVQEYKDRVKEFLK